MSGPAATPTPSESRTAEEALCRSVLWEALALGFRPPAAETGRRLLAPDGAAALADAAAWLDQDRGTALAPLARGLGQQVGLPAVTAAYQRLFGHTARGLVPPYETEYGADSLFQPIHEMSDLAAFYRAFGLALRDDARERPHHVACECEFLAFVARKEAYADRHGAAALLEGCRQGLRRFLADHLGRWVPAFGRALTRHDPGGFYGGLGRLATAYVTAECERVGVPAGPEFLRLRTAADPDVPAACGAAAGQRCATHDFEPEPLDRPAPARERIREAVPHWTPADSLCRQCAELYRARLRLEKRPRAGTHAGVPAGVPRRAARPRGPGPGRAARQACRRDPLAGPLTEALPGRRVGARPRRRKRAAAGRAPQPTAMRAGVQGGSKVSVTSTCSTPGIPRTARRTQSVRAS